MLRFRTLLLIAILWSSVNAWAQEDFYRQLRSPCRMTSTGRSALDVLKSLRNAHSMNIWIDRRIDHSVAIDISRKKPSLEETFLAIAEQLEAEASFCDRIVIFAPQGIADVTATSILRLREALRKQPTSNARKLLSRTRLHWEDLATPSDIAGMIRDEWKVEIPLDRMEHDLWNGQVLQDIDATDAVVLLTQGFGITPASIERNGQFSFAPMPASLRCKIRYPVSKVPETLLASLREFDPTVAVAKAGVLLWLRVPPSYTIGSTCITQFASPSQWRAESLLSIKSIQ